MIRSSRGSTACAGSIAGSAHANQVAAHAPDAGRASCLTTSLRPLQMMELAAFSDTPASSVTRLVFSLQDIAARRHVACAACFLHRSIPCNAVPAPLNRGVLMYTPLTPTCEACRHIKGLMRRAGLTVREDAMGNIFGRWQGSRPGVGAAHIRASNTGSTAALRGICNVDHTLLSVCCHMTKYVAPRSCMTHPCTQTR